MDSEFLLTTSGSYHLISKYRTASPNTTLSDWDICMCWKVKEEVVLSDRLTQTSLLYRMPNLIQIFFPNSNNFSTDSIIGVKRTIFISDCIDLKLKIRSGREICSKLTVDLFSQSQMVFTEIYFRIYLRQTHPIPLNEISPLQPSDLNFFIKFQNDLHNVFPFSL